MAYQGSITLVDLSDGSSGSSGINTATVYLYQRAINIPSGPNGTLTYNFSTHSLNGSTAAFNGWESSIGNLSGDNPIWIIAATATASVDAENDNILANEWSNPIKMAQDGQDGQQGPPGQDGTPGTPGQDGAPGLNGINTATVYIYKRAASAPNIPNDVTYTFEDGSFIPPSGWNKQVPTTDGNPCYVSSAIAIGNGATATLEWSTPAILAEDGEQGEQGAQGASVIAERELYYLKTNSSEVPQISNSNQITSTDRQNGWTSIVPTYVNNGDYYTCIETTLDDDGTTTILWSTPILNRGLTNANANAASALIQAGEASTATSLLGGHFIYRANGTESTPASANVIQTVSDNPGQWGYNVHIGSNGIKLRNNEITLSEWTSTALNFYNPINHNVNATLSANGLIVSKGGITAGNLYTNKFVYLSTEDYPLREYGKTSDSVIDNNKTYYTLEPQSYNIVETPVLADLDTYYELVESYVLTSDITIVEGKIYYQLENNEYVVVENPIVDDIDSYYELFEEYQLTSDTVIDEDKNYYRASQYNYVAVTNPTVSDIANYYELKEPGITINNHTPAKEDTNIQQLADDIPWRAIIGDKFGVDAGGNLYAAGGLIGNDRSAITIDNNGINISGTNVNFDIISNQQQTQLLNDTIGASEWLSTHASFVPTTDTEVILDKQYYEEIGDYIITSDTSVVVGKTYYTRTGDGSQENPYVYTIVSNPTDSYISTYYEYEITGYNKITLSEEDSPVGYYELENVKEAVSDFISTHMSLTPQGLWIQGDKVEKYKLTTDLTIDVDKTYYQLENGKYVKVENPTIDNINNYYELFEETDYRVLITSDGMYIYGPKGVISKFSEDIEFYSSQSQHIGGHNSYIEFDAETGKLNIVADNIMIGRVDESDDEREGKDILETIEDIEGKMPAFENDLQTQMVDLATQKELLVSQQTALDSLMGPTGYVAIDATESTIRLGEKNTQSYVEISGKNNDLRVSIKVNDKNVAYMSGNPPRFYAPSAVISNLYMQTSLQEDNPIGAIGWVMRTNGHLSLKRIV